MINRFCCAFPLKVGVVVASLLWLVAGIATIVKCILDLTKGASMLKFSSGYAVIMIIISGLTTIGAAFGLYAITYEKSKPRMILRYSIIAYCIVAIIIIGNIAAIAVLLLYKSNALERCNEEDKSSKCNEGYSNCLASAIFSAIVSSILSFYFAAVISAYVHESTPEILEENH